MYLYLNLYIIYDIINMQRDTIINTFICIGVLYYLNQYLENLLNTNAIELQTSNTQLYKCTSLIEDQEDTKDENTKEENSEEYDKLHKDQTNNQLTKIISDKKQKLLSLKNNLDLIKNQLERLKNDLDGPEIS